MGRQPSNSSFRKERSNEMSYNDVKFNAAVTKCYFCGESYEVVINTLLTAKAAREVEELNGKVIDMNPCNKCEEYMKQGIMLITFDPAKSDPEWNKSSMPNPYRTGGFFVVTESAFKRIFHPKKLVDYGLKARWLFIEHEAAVQLGLFASAEVKDASAGEQVV
jgi:hypothetical protein